MSCQHLNSYKSQHGTDSYFRLHRAILSPASAQGTPTTLVKTPHKTPPFYDLSSPLGRSAPELETAELFALSRAPQ